MRAHEAGWAHAEGAFKGPGWLREPADPNRLVPHLWSTTAHRGEDGALSVGGMALADLVADHNTPAYVLDEADFRARARAFRDAFAGYEVFYAGKAFLCTEVARWVAEEGLSLDVCSEGELTVALRAGFDPAWTDFLVARIAGAVVEAHDTREPAVAAIGSTEVWGLTRNHRDPLDPIVDPKLELGCLGSAPGPAERQ